MNNTVGYILCEDTTGLVKPDIVTSDNNTTKIKATLQTVDNKNRNKRTYTKDAIQSGMDTEYVQELLRNKTLYGEAGHPISKDIKRMVNIDQGNISHIITSMYWDTANSNTLKGVIETANTNVGRDMKGLIDQGSKVAFSLRALGPTTKKDGEILVEGPLKIITYDWVIFPSHKEAYMEGILSESARDIIEANVMMEDGIEIPVNLEQYDLVDVLMHTSEDFRDFSDQLEFDLDRTKLSLNESKDHVYMNMGGKKAIAKIEDYTRLELDELLRSKL